MLTKKAIAILGAIFLLIVGTLGFLIYQRKVSKKVAEVPVTQTTEESKTPPVENIDQTDNGSASGGTTDNGNAISQNIPNEAVLSGAVKLTDDQVVSPVLFFQGNGITYFAGSGQLFQTDLQTAEGKSFLTNKRELTILQKSGITKILWPSSGNNFIAEFQNTAGRRWSFYDSDRGVYVDLPPQITSLSWMPGGEKIVYIWLDEKGQSTLNIANGDNSNYQTIADIWENDDEISVSPDGQNILFYRRNNNDVKNSLNLTTADGKIFKSVVKDGYNYGVLWSPGSQKFLFGKRDPVSQKYQLWLGDIASSQVRNLGISTIPEKAVWTSDGQNIFASVPEQGDPNRGLTQDKLVKINVVTGDSKEYSLGTAVDARNLFLNFLGDKVFFKNLQDGALYYMDVSK